MGSCRAAAWPPLLPLLPGPDVEGQPLEDERLRLDRMTESYQAYALIGALTFGFSISILWDWVNDFRSGVKSGVARTLVLFFLAVTVAAGTWGFSMLSIVVYVVKVRPRVLALAGPVAGDGMLPG